MMMRRSALLVLALLAIVGQQAHAQRRISERHAVVPAGFVRIAVPAGHVQVRGWNRDTLVVTGTVPPGFDIEITRQGAKVGFWTDASAGAGPAQITVFVPARSRLWIKTTDAKIQVGDVAGGLDLFSVTGTVNVTGAPREVYAETMQGEITLTNVQTGTARLKTAGGAIRVSGQIADLTAISVAGEIEVARTAFGRARLESVQGDIGYTGAIQPAAVMDVINHAGRINLSLPAHTAADFSFNLYEADLQDEFGIKKRWMMSNKFKAREMTFGVGDRPGARITIRSFKGPVAIRRWPEP